MARPLLPFPDDATPFLLVLPLPLTKKRLLVQSKDHYHLSTRPVELSLMMIPSSAIFDQSTLTALLDHDPVVQTYRAFFSLLDWSVVEQWQERRSVYCDTHGHPISAYLKAFLIRIHRGMIYATQLRSFLLTHPLLIIELGFHLHLDPTTPYGFDAEKTLPCRFWFSQKLRTLDPALLQALLHATVRDLKAEIPGLGEVVAFDVKHIYGLPSRKTMSASTFPIAMIKPKRWSAIPIAPWASNVRPTRNNPMAAPKRKRNCSGATAPASPLPPSQAMVMSCS